MTISFTTIPANLRVPLAYVEFDNSLALLGTPDMPYKILVLGQKLAAGLAAAETPMRITSYDQAEALFGRGSMLAAMFFVLKANNRYTESWAIPLADDGEGVAAAGTITIGGLPTASGMIYCYIAGTRIRVSVASGDTPTVVATALAAAINADTSLPVTAVAAAGVITLTARNAGECGNDIDIRINYYQGETLPAGLTAAVVLMSGGAGNPDISGAIAAMGDEWYQAVVMPYTDAANMTLLETELASRFGGTRQNDGIAYCAYRGTHSATGTFGDGRNSPHVTCMGTGDSPMPSYLWAAVYAAQASAALAIDPARPLQTLVMAGILPPTEADRWTDEELNLLLYDGIATCYVDAGGQVRIQREVSMYQLNPYGVADTSYLDITTQATISYMRYSWRARVTNKYPRHKLADDGTNYGPGQAIVTPSTIRAEAVAIGSEWENAGLLEDFEQYKQDLIVERDSDDRNRLNMLIPPNVVNGLRILAAKLQFRL